jgi:hypothetical protein
MDDITMRLKFKLYLLAVVINNFKFDIKCEIQSNFLIIPQVSDLLYYLDFQVMAV